MGVRRAVDIVYKAIESDTAVPIHTFGPIIHNNSVINDLEEKGVKVLNTPEKGRGTVIIRAHGIQPGLKRELENRAVVLDATCPRVLSSQKTVFSFSRQGYLVILVGDKHHGEVQGLEGFADSHIVIGTTEEAEIIPLSEKNMVIAQTTFDEKLYDRICTILKRRCPKVKVVDSICPATVSRQSALRDLCREVDALLVIGGKNSGNTKRLYQTAVELCAHVWHIEDEHDLPSEIFLYRRIGISAGASTPDWVIKEIEECLFKNSSLI